MSIEALNESEINLIEEFRKKHQTTVLTIMFTDIEGFTELTEKFGDIYSSMVRHKHDELLSQAIERHYGGKIIKHIGDAIMAVFSEPSKAVEAGLKIQKILREFNKNRPSEYLTDINVRIGIHMGQVASENNGGQSDFYGRHVNRASRIESLAGGGQIYVSNSVYDSAKGWIDKFEGEEVVWTSHGRYAVKGIPDGLDVFEINEKKFSSPKPPAKKDEKFSNQIKIFSLCALSIFLVFCTFYVFKKPTINNPSVNELDKKSISAPLSKVEVNFIDGEADGLILNNKERIITKENKFISDNLTPGRHFVYFHRSEVVRYFMDFNIQLGKNVVPIKLEYSQMPELNVQWDFNFNNLELIKNENEASFFSYNQNGEKVTFNSKQSIQITPLNNKQATLSYSLMINNKEIVNQSEEINLEKINLEKEEKIIFSDWMFNLYLIKRKSSDSLVVSIEGKFVDIKK